MPSSQSSLPWLRSRIAANAELTMGVIDLLLADIELAAQQITNCFLSDGKLLSCGSAASAAISEYCASVFANRLERERPGLPAIALSASPTLNQSINHSYSQHDLHARQVRTLGSSSDCLIVFAPGNDSAACVQAVGAAHDREMAIIAITGAEDLNLSAVLTPEDTELKVQTESQARLVEAQLLITHCLCEVVEYQLFALESE